MPRVTLSYRREDSSAAARAIYDRLRARYGLDSVFMDIDAIEFGEDYRKRIYSALRETDYLLVLMGQRWVGPLPTGRNRIMDANDPVRLEVERALEINLKVIPILLEHTTMPSPDDLPESLHELPFLNAADISTGREFDSQMERIIRFIDRTFAETEARRARELEQKRVDAIASVTIPPVVEEVRPQPPPPVVEVVRPQPPLPPEPEPVSPPITTVTRPAATKAFAVRYFVIVAVALVGAGLALILSQYHPVANVAPETPAVSQNSDIPIVGSWIQTRQPVHPTIYVFVADGTATWHDDNDKSNKGTWTGSGTTYTVRWNGSSDPETFEIAPGGQTATQGGPPQGASLLKRM
jgi:hypothetical protein